MRVASILIGSTKNKFYALAFMLLLGFSFANAQTLDQQSLQENPDQWEISSTNAEIGQSFTAGYSGTLHSIVLNVFTAGEPITFKIYDGEGFTGTVLSTQTVNITSTGLLTIIPASTVNLTATNKYSFSMTPTGVFNLVWFKSSCCSDFYTGGSLYKNGAIFSPARDFLFTTYVNVAPANPTITLGTNPSVCFGSTSANLTYSATTNTPNEYSIDFDAAAETAGFVDVALTALPVSPISIVVPGAAPASIYNATITVKNTTSGLSSAGDAFTVTVNTLPSGSASITSAITCNNLTDGSITVSPAGGSGSGYTYKEVGGGYQAGALFTGLANGSHSFVVKDGNSCESSTSISASLANPSVVSITSATKLSYNGSDLTCFGQSDGQITVIASGGTGALEYSKNNGGIFQTPSNIFSGLSENPYTILVKDANGCLSASTVVTINQATAINGTVSNSGPICANNLLTLGGNIIGGTGALTFSWTGPIAFTSAASATLARTVSANATVAMAGLYNITAKDLNNCIYQI
jgi:hypothetical protein